MQINSWNYRGLGNLAKAKVVKDLLKMNPLDILLFQETKIEEDALLSISKSKWKKNASMAVSARALLEVWLPYGQRTSFISKISLEPNTGYSQNYNMFLAI